MTSKPKITLLNQNRYLFQHLLRHYQQAIQLTESGEYLQPPDVFRMLDAMGYLCHEKTEKDYELISSLTFMLAFPKGQGIVSQRNLFQFLTIINSLSGNVDSHFEMNVQALPKDAGQLDQPLVQISIGNFDEKGIWKVSKEQEKSIRQVFSSMIFTRVSRHDINTNKKRQAEILKKENFQPKILNKSINIAQSRFKRLQLQDRVENRLLQAKEINNSKLQAQIRAREQNALKECSFNPRINSKSKYLRQNSPYAKQDILLLKGQQYQQRRRQNRNIYEQFKSSQQLSQCSFHPNLTSSTSSLRNSYSQEMGYHIRNKDKSVQRMRVARQQRQSLNEFNRRGYPKDKSWVGFMQEVRTKRCNTNVNNHSLSRISTISQKPIIFTMDLKILGEQKHVQVKEADDILQMTQRICKNHNINLDNYQKVYNMIEKTLRQSGDALIKNGKVFLFKKK